MKRDPLKQIPRSIIVTPDMMKPSFPEAFTRWKELGEWPADARLCKLSGCPWGGASLVDVVSGEAFDVDDETLETLTHVQVKNAVPSQRFYQILRKNG